MDDNFKILDLNDEDVLYFSDDSLFKFGYFKKKIKSEIQTRTTSQRTINAIRNQFTNWSINNFHGCQANDITIKVLLPSDAKECEILRLGYQRWQKGKLLVEVDLNYSAVSDEPNNQPQWEIQEINFYFKPDEPEISQPESPLDDLRQRINQDNQSDNQ
ncbi:MAG: KGK domain-containing protein [Coleofasciculus sp. C1-SOL-03]|uniref:KGK domain-containing protein n=1 Tax=Coleofasciculus sp. C1-SOL-03 TaxID=3069522 RepID=UPI0032F58ACA